MVSVIRGSVMASMAFSFSYLPCFLLADVILPRLGGGLCAYLEQHKADI